MCDGFSAAMFVGSAVMTTIASDQQAEMAEDQAYRTLEQARKSNEANRENYLTSINNLALQRMEDEKQEGNLLDQNARARMEAEGTANVTTASAGVTGNSINVLMRDLSSSFGREESIIQQQFKAKQEAMERQKSALQRQAKYGVVRPEFNLSGYATNNILKIGGAAIEAIGDSYDRTDGFTNSATVGKQSKQKQLVTGTGKR